jgi:hypothetical protein
MFYLLILSFNDNPQITAIVLTFSINRDVFYNNLHGTKDYSYNLCVQTGSEDHPASCTMCTGGPFLGGRARTGSDADHPTPSSAKVVNE